MKNSNRTFGMKLFTEEDVLKIIKCLNNSLATRVDFIDTQTEKLVKEKSSWSFDINNKHKHQAINISRNLQALESNTIKEEPNI